VGPRKKYAGNPESTGWSGEGEDNNLQVFIGKRSNAIGEQERDEVPLGTTVLRKPHRFFLRRRKKIGGPVKKVACGGGGVTGVKSRGSGGVAGWGELGARNRECPCDPREDLVGVRGGGTGAL